MVYCMYFFSFSKLDEILKKEEKASCQTYFRKVLSENRNLAIKLVNDTRITFPCFFVLMPVVEKENIYSLLREDLKKAYDFSKSVSANKPSNLKKDIKNKILLKWMVESSHLHNNLGGDFNEVVDVAVSILANEYRELSLLGIISELIFMRNRYDENIHDLVWAYFRFNTPITLKYIARFLDSKNPKDRKLAKKLLGCEAKSCKDFLKYMTEDESKMIYTDESFQYASNPRVYAAKEGTDHDLHKGKQV
jgi:hypothetical protein